jgi:hypothetical protein
MIAASGSGAEDKILFPQKILHQEHQLPVSRTPSTSTMRCLMNLLVIPDTARLFVERFTWHWNLC